MRELTRFATSARIMGKDFQLIPNSAGQELVVLVAYADGEGNVAPECDEHKIIVWRPVLDGDTDTPVMQPLCNAPLVNDVYSAYAVYDKQKENRDAVIENLKRKSRKRLTQ